MSYFFKAEHLSVGYNGKPLLKEIEIELEKGSILTLIGPNGAGKTTILKSITGQLQPIAGVLYLGEEELQKISGQELAKKMAIVLTQKLLTEKMTCEDVVRTGRYPYTGQFGILSREDKRAVEEAMVLVGVDHLRNQDFTCISDGQRQRVMLARALCQEPEILILDEPTSYLDIRYKLEFLTVLQKLCRTRGVTVIMSLHELELAERISDLILCVNHEGAERLGTPGEIFQPGILTTLFSLSVGSFDEKNGNAELPRAEGKPEIFVIAGGGSGREVYRSLQRKGIPFATGILYENDLDYPVAKALAITVIGTQAFEPVPEETLKQAENIMRECGSVICCREHFGSLEQANAELLKYAELQGLKIDKNRKESETWQK